MFSFDNVIRRSLRCGGMFFIAFFFVGTLISWGQPAGSASTRVQHAKNMFNEGKFDETIATLVPLAEDGSLDTGIKRDVLHYLGRCYVIKDLQDKALSAITQLIMLTKPPVELDPDAENTLTMSVYYEAWKNIFGSDSLRADPGTKTMAVLDFGNYLVAEDAAKYDRLQWGLAKLLNLALGSKGVKIQLIDRSRTAYILQEIKLENDPKTFDINTAVRVGKQMGVHLMVFGSFIGVSADDVTMTADIVRVETSVIEKSVGVRGDLEDVFELATSLAGEVAKALNIVIDRQQLEASIPTRSENAWGLYSDGIRLEEAGDFVAAYEKYLNASKFDPTFDLARKKAESLRPLIG